MFLLHWLYLKCLYQVNTYLLLQDEGLDHYSCLHSSAGSQRALRGEA